MSKNLTRKGLALATALSFGLTGLTATAPAYAAAGDVVSIEPTTGTGYGSYDTESFSVSSSIDTDAVNTSSYDKLAIQLTNVDSEDLVLDFSDGLYGIPTVVTGSTNDLCVLGANVLLTTADGETTTAIFTDVAASTSGSAEFATQAACESATFTGADGSGTLDFTVDGVSYVKAVVDLANVATTWADVTTQITAASSTVGDNLAVGFTSFLDTDNDELLEAGEQVSKTETVNFYDITKVSLVPRIERFVADAAYLNTDDDSNRLIGTSVQFSPSLNIDQLTTANLDFDVTTGTTPATNVSFTQKMLAGATEYSPAGKLYGVSQAAAALASGVAYSVSAYYTGATTKTTTSGFTVPSQTSTTTNVAGFDATNPVVATDSTNSNFSTPNFALAAETKAFTYKATADAEKANVPVLAIVTATDLATDGSLTVGSKKLAEGEAFIASGVTNSDGEYSVTVTSALAKAGEDYTVRFYYLATTGLWTAGTAYTATYEKAAVDSITAASDVVAGANISIKFNIKDQFGKASSVSSTGKALFARLYSSVDVKKLDKYVAVTAGSASFAFANYLAKGENDTLNVELGTGGVTEDDFDALSPSETDTVALYNPEAAAAITVSSVIEDQAITYDKFITGTAEATSNPQPLDEDAIPYTGTVVDADGNGIPGAVVTVSGAGLQFQDDVAAGDFYKDSITLAADTAGAFDLNIWAHKVSSTGITINVTSGGKSATTKLTTVANGSDTGAAADNGDITADDLVFTWDAPKHPRVDTTYITAVKLTDKWGNPLSGANVTVDAAGALLINGDDTVTKTTSAAGVVRVYFRSLTKTDGIANISATLNSVVVKGTTLTTPTGDTFENVLSSDVVVGADAVAVAGKKAGTAKVVAYNASGKTATVYVNGKKVATKKLASSRVAFAVKAKAGATVKVMIGTSTFFNGVAY